MSDSRKKALDENQKRLDKAHDKYIAALNAAKLVYHEEVEYANGKLLNDIEVICRS